MTATEQEEISSDHKAFEILVREHHRRILAYALALTPRHDLAEDLVQDAFIIAYRQLSDFDPKRDFGAWVRGIVHNKFREHWRRNLETPMDPQVLKTLDDQHAEWDGLEQTPGTALKALKDCVTKLPDSFRQPVQLFYFERKSGATIAEELDTAEATLRKRLERARGKLAACVTDSLKALEA